MKPRTRIILLSLISILIVVTIVLGVTYSFMKADIESSSVTEVSLKSCAKITLKDTDVSINLNNTYPMSKNKALQTTPYTFTVSSSCENYVGFNLYLATLNTNTLNASNIHYIITYNGSKDILAEGILSNATNAESEFSNEEKTQLNSGINGTYGSIYKLYNAKTPLQEEKTYDLYLYVDESVTNASTMNKSFKAGIAIKSFDYNFSQIANVSVTDVTSDSISIELEVNQGESNINKYYYSIDNGKTYVESLSNTYTFSGLEAEKEYNIKVYAIDNNGYETNNYSLSVSTVKEEEYINPVVRSFTTYSSSTEIRVETNVTEGSSKITKYYYSINNGTYKESNSNSYTFTGLSSGTNYTIKVYVVDENGVSSNIISKTIKTPNASSGATLADVCPNGGNFSNCIKKLYTEGGEGANGLYYHNADLTNGANDNSYRYSGSNPNNYVCFGSRAATCPNDNLYRIIGVFDEDSDGEYNVKLIKADYTTSAMLGTDGRDYYGSYDDVTSYYQGSMDTSTIAGYRWNYDTSVVLNGSNKWTTSELNKINLNTNYINYLGSSWGPMIEDSKWYLGGMTSSSNTAKSFYTGERNNAGYGSNPTRYTAKIGLMYPSDYGYAAYSDAWVTNLNSYSSSTIKENNWLYMRLYEWTITPISSNSSSVFCLTSSGLLLNRGANDGYSVRPVFYLKSNILYASGDGTKASPFRVSV